MAGGFSVTPPPAAAARQRPAILAPGRPTVIVVSHERSGTHFLMNALARGYGYVSKPWINFDYDQIPINFHAAKLVGMKLGSLADQRVANVIKSHHAVAFFDGILDDLLAKAVIFYIHRDPASVMLSFWRYTNHWKWREGPKRDDPLAFARAEPEGQLMRYQMHQRRNMLDRWAHHVEGWVDAAKKRPRIRVVRFDELNEDYARTITGFRDILKVRPVDLTPPPPDENVVAKTAAVGGTALPARQALHELALSEVGVTMRRLGYA